MFKTALHENGLLRLPKHIVEHLALQTGDTLCCRMEDRILYVTPEKEFNPTFSPPLGYTRTFPASSCSTGPSGATRGTPGFSDATRWNFTARTFR